MDRSFPFRIIRWMVDAETPSIVAISDFANANRSLSNVDMVLGSRFALWIVTTDQKRAQCATVLQQSPIRLFRGICLMVVRADGGNNRGGVTTERQLGADY